MEQQPEPSAQAPKIEDPAPTEVVENAPVAEQPAQTSTKQVHSLVIDANAIIRNDPTVSTLLSQAEELYTIPAVVSESVWPWEY